MNIIELVLDEENNEIGIEAISVVENPAIEEDFIALSGNMIELKEADKEKKLLVGALLIPNQYTDEVVTKNTIYTCQKIQ